MLNDKTAKLLSVDDEYPDGANVPTRIYKYECPCGKGVIQYCRVSGFGDYYTDVECPTCKEKYNVEMGKGYAWELVEKK